MIIYIILLSLLAGIGKGTRDRLLLPHHYNNSIFKNFKDQRYFDPLISGENKYKNYDKKQGAKFPGSTNIFVWVTDLPHLSASITIISFCGIALLSSNVDLNNFKEYILLFLYIRIPFAIGFYSFYKLILIKKRK